MIPITKPYLPNREILDSYIDGIYERQWLTNNGPLVQELTRRLEKYLGVENLLLVSNGTLALQIAYKALGIHEPVNGKPAQAITTPFTFVATASSLQWEGIEPVFADIDSKTWCLSPENIAEAITAQTRAIVPVHVFGNACDVVKIQNIAERYNLKVIYDAAHAFGVNHSGESILKWGDASTLSFHATKIFHTIEGGAIVFKRKEDLDKAHQLINFGITGPDQIGKLGINAKMSEFNAAMGLANLDEISLNTRARQQLWDHYRERLSAGCRVQRCSPDVSNNHAYFPVVLRSRDTLERVVPFLQQHGIGVRRYFYPSLSRVEFLNNSQKSMPVSESISERIVCLPLYSSLTFEEQEAIIFRLGEVIAQCQGLVSDSPND